MFCSAETLVALLAVIVASLYFYYVKIYKQKKFLSNFPSPPTSLPILGCILDIRTPTGFLQKLHEYTKICGSMVHLQVGPIGHALLSSDPKFLEFLLSSNKLLKKSINLKFLEPWLGTGLATADGGPKWKMHRKLITPTFHFKILEQFLDTFESGGNLLVQNLSKESGNKSVDIYPYITRCTLEIICETAMGTKVDVQNDDTSSYVRSVKEMCRIFLVRSTSVFLLSDFVFSFTKDYKIQQEALKILHGYTNKVITAKRAELKEKRKDSNVDELGRKKKKAFLDLLLETTVDDHSLSDEEIREEVDTFMFGGHDTTATATSFILFCIANNKEVQDKILEEQEQILGNDKYREVTYSKLQEMKYLENVIKEGLRLYPPVPLFGRLIDQEVEYNGMVIPKNLPVGIFVHGLHMNPKYYPNPEKFDPGRFENYDNKLPFAFIPFSAGPRNCIGQKYAMLEIKSLLSKIVRNFELSPASPQHDLQLAPETVLKSLNGVRVGIKLR